MAEEDLVYESLASIEDDLSPQIYQRYFELCPESAALMEHTDDHMRGRMLEEVFRLLLNPDTAAESEYLQFEVGNHNAYGAQVHMYANVLIAVRDCVQSALGAAGWEQATADAWDARVSAIVSAIEAANQHVQNALAEQLATAR